MKMAKIAVSCFLFIMVFFVSDVKASWQGPTEMLITQLGSGVGQVGISYGDSGDDFARSFGVSRGGYVVIADPINEALHVFNANGVFQRDIKNPLVWLGWPADVIVNGECAVVGYVEHTYTYNVLTGELVGKADNMGGIDYITDDCAKIYVNSAKDGWKSYSPTGTLLKTYTERPLELGRYSTKADSAGGYTHVVTFPDNIYSFTLPWMGVNHYQRDLSGNLIVAAQGDPKDVVYKIGMCGNILGQLLIPETKKHFLEMLGPEEIEELEEEYGSPLVAPNGDVYTWKRTPDRYSIIKWKWVDDPADVVNSGPDAPASLAVAPTPTTVPAQGLVVSWGAALQDPGCVTGYEVSRSTSATGSYAALGMMSKGVLTYTDATATAGQTYYYKVRAASGTAYSPYTNAMSGKRP